MADGGLTLHFDERFAHLLREAAERRGVDVETFAREHFDYLAEDGDPADWASAEAAVAEYRQTGKAVGLEEALAKFDAELEYRLSKRR